jgi:hypothetical protein
MLPLDSQSDPPGRSLSQHEECRMRRSSMAVGLFVLATSVAGAQDAKFAFIDLQPKANQVLQETLSDSFDNAHLAELPQGEQKFEGVPFEIGPGCICLGSMVKTNKPDKVEIPVKRKFQKLLLLHATQFGGAAENPTFIKDGTGIGQYLVRYSDGSGEGIPIVYGEDVRDWWNWDKSKPTTRGKIAWTGTSPAAKMYHLDVRLYQSEWKNPKPELMVESIVYSSNMEIGAPMCVALTVQE